MPGKVNPVMCEMVIQVAGQVLGNEHAITMGYRESFFEFNISMPAIAHNLSNRSACCPPPRASSPIAASAASKPTSSDAKKWSSSH